MAVRAYGYLKNGTHTLRVSSPKTLLGDYISKPVGTTGIEWDNPACEGLQAHVFVHVSTKNVRPAEFKPSPTMN